MLLLIFAAASAYDSAFECPTLTTPSDGLVYADVGARSEAVFDTLVALVRAEFEPGCPATCDDSGSTCYVDDCVTSTGTHLVVDYRAATEGDTWDGVETETWEVTVTPASGPYTRLTLSSSSEGTWARGGGHGYAYSGSHAWTATWAGEVDPAFPSDRTVTVTLSESASNDDYFDYASSRTTEAWDDGACLWDAVEGHSYWDSWDAFASWSIGVGDQTLTLSESVASCDASILRDATLDGVTTRVVDPDWTPAVDADGDGVDASADCDDTDAATNPCAEDTPDDGIDQDCDGADTVDADDDGWVTTGRSPDCDDADPTVYPGATEIVCDDVDQDCNSRDERDEDNDGYEPATCGGDDCDDADRDVNPDERDDLTDGIDQDCDGVDGVDADGDGYAAARGGGDDCDDRAPDIHPGATDIPYDRVDQDCADGDLLDADGDGHDALAEGGDDCDDTTADVHPDATEIPCDGADQDCDGVDPACAEDTDTGGETAAEPPEEEPPPSKEPAGGCASTGPREGGAALLVAALLLAGRRRARR